MLLLQKYVLFIRNSNLTGCLVFYLTTLLGRHSLSRDSATEMPAMTSSRCTQLLRPLGVPALLADWTYSTQPRPATEAASITLLRMSLLPPLDPGPFLSSTLCPSPNASHGLGRVRPYAIVWMRMRARSGG